MLVARASLDADAVRLMPMPTTTAIPFARRHDLGEEARELLVAHHQIVGPLEVRSHATEPHQRRSRPERHARHRQLQFIVVQGRDAGVSNTSNDEPGAASQVRSRRPRPADW